MKLPARIPISILALSLAFTPSHAFAVNKDMVQLQTQIQDLQDAVAKLQQSNDERMGVLKDLVQQNSDSVNKMSLTIDAITKLIRSENEATSGKLDQVSGQTTALNDSTDEIKARLNRLEKSIQDVQNQLQSINGVIQNMTPNPAATAALPSTPGLSAVPADIPPAPAALPPAPTSSQQQPIINRRGGKPPAGVPMATTAPLAPIPVPAAPATPVASDLYKTALSDYMAAKYPLASSEFGQVIHLYPDDTLAGTASYYLGEIDYRSGKYAAAVKDYDHVLEQFPDNAKIPVSHLHKGMALIALKQNDAAIREMRALITRFPASPEAAQARTKLNGMGVPVTPKPRP